MAAPDLPIESIGPVVHWLSIDRLRLPMRPSLEASLDAQADDGSVSLVGNAVAMNLQMLHGTSLLVLTVIAAMPAKTEAQMPKPLERFGRLQGVCWGDGYHACKSSGCPSTGGSASDSPGSACLLPHSDRARRTTG